MADWGEKMKVPPRIFPAKLTDGAIHPLVRKAIAAHIRLTYKADEEIQISIEPLRKRHTDPQRGYWYAVIIPHAIAGMKDAGNRDANKDNVHDFLLWHLLPDKRETLTVNGKSHTERARMSKLSKSEVCDLIDQAIQFIAETFGIVCPEPTK